MLFEPSSGKCSSGLELIDELVVLELALGERFFFRVFVNFFAVFYG